MPMMQPDQASTLVSAAPPVPDLLVAEDDTNLRRLVALGLRRAGFSVIEAEDGNRALNILADRTLEQTPLRGVVMDVRMPGHDGLSILRAINRDGGELPFVVVTAFGDDQLHRRAMDYGARAVLDKPFTIDLLCATALRHFGVPAGGPRAGYPAERTVVYAPYDALLLDRYLEVFNRVVARHRTTAAGPTLPNVRGRVHVRLTGGHDPATTVFTLRWERGRFERCQATGEEPGWLTVDIDRDHLEEVIATPWRYFAAPQRLALWI